MTRPRWRVVTQGDPVQGAEWVTPGECTRRGRDQRANRNPATLVTPTIRCPVLIYLATANQPFVSRYGSTEALGQDMHRQARTMSAFDTSLNAAAQCQALSPRIGRSKRHSRGRLAIARGRADLSWRCSLFSVAARRICCARARKLRHR